MIDRPTSTTAATLITPRSWFDRHPKLTLSAFTLMGCIVAVVVAEGAARLLFPQWTPPRQERATFWTYSESLGWEHVPGHQARFNHRDFSVDVSINAHGLGDTEYSVERTEKKRMLILGDSFGWGFGVEHQERFSEILESIHLDWEIINASVSGYSTDQEYLQLKEKDLMSFRPDVVLLLFCQNDFRGNASSNMYWRFKPYFVVEDGRLTLMNVPVPEANLRQRLDRFFLGRTYLGPRIYFVLGWLQSLITTVESVSEAEVAANKRSVYAVTDSLVTAISDASRNAGADFILVSIPMDLEERTRLHGIAEKGDFPYLPLDPYFESEQSPVTFPHDAHWNAHGHEIAARAIEAFLLEQGIFESTGPER